MFVFAKLSPGGAKVRHERANGSGKYLKLLVSWECIQKLMLRKALKVRFQLLTPLSVWSEN